jgi:DNA repair exonuclease SbcCD ATPase subunit
MSDLRIGTNAPLVAELAPLEGAITPLEGPRLTIGIADLQAAIELAGPVTKSTEALADFASTASSSAIRTARHQITTLKSTITSLEAVHSTKLTEIGQIEAQIASRKTDLQNEHERKRRVGMLGCLFGVPAVGLVSLVMMQQDDARLKQLDRELVAARSAKDTANTKASAYRALKERLEEKLDRLVDAAERIPSAPPIVPGEPAHMVRAAGSAINHSQKLLSNLRSQIQLLEELRDSAAELGATLEGHLITMRANLKVAEGLVADSRKDLIDLIKIIVAKDPNAAANSFLKKKAMSAVRALLKEAGLSFDPFVNRLLEGVPAGPARDQLASRLRTAFENATGFPFGRTGNAGTDGSTGDVIDA